jgi:hypothetical protein
MARPMTETTKSIIAVLEKNPEITYNEAVDQGLVNPELVPATRFNVTKYNFTHGKIVSLSSNPKATATKQKLPVVPKAKTTNGRKANRRSGPVRTLVNAPSVDGLPVAMKTVADPGGLAKPKAFIAQADLGDGREASVMVSFGPGNIPAKLYYLGQMMCN